MAPLRRALSRSALKVSFQLTATNAVPGAAEITAGLNEKEQVVIGGKTATPKKTSALTAQKGH